MPVAIENHTNHEYKLEKLPDLWKPNVKIEKYADISTARRRIH